MKGGLAGADGVREHTGLGWVCGVRSAHLLVQFRETHSQNAFMLDTVSPPPTHTHPPLPASDPLQGPIHPTHIVGISIGMVFRRHPVMCKQVLQPLL